MKIEKLVLLATGILISVFFTKLMHIILLISEMFVFFILKKAEFIVPAIAVVMSIFFILIGLFCIYILKSNKEYLKFFDTKRFAITMLLMTAGLYLLNVLISFFYNTNFVLELPNGALFKIEYATTIIFNVFNIIFH